MPAVPYMMLACFSSALWPFHTINLKGIVALGRSDVFLKLEIIKKIACVVVIMTSFRLGVLPWMIISAFVLGPFSLIVNAWPNKRLLGYTIGMQLRDVMPTMVVCVAEAAVVFGIGIACNQLKPMLGVGDKGTSLMVFLCVKLVLQVVFGAGVFLGLAYIFRLKSMGEYAHMMAVALKVRCPRIAAVLEGRFAT